MNELCAVTFMPSQTQIDTLERFAGVYTLEQVRTMLTQKVSAWGGSESMRHNLTPSTLFSAKHFQDYMENSMISFPTELVRVRAGERKGRSKDKKSAVQPKKEKSAEAQARADLYKSIF